MEPTPLHERIRELARNQYHEKGVLSLYDFAEIGRREVGAERRSEIVEA